MYRRDLLIGTLTAALLIPASATSQTSAGGIAGTVKDITGAMLPGVTVEASSDALIERVRSATTDNAGQYRITELRPGVYSVTFTLPGFATIKREKIELTSGFTANVSVEMRVGAVEETVTVTGSSPVVDIQNVKQQVVMTRNVVDSIPTGRTFQNLGVLVPGMAGVGTSQDVGGQSGETHSRLAIHGGRPGDQTIQLDGMAMNTWHAPADSGVSFTDGNFQEIVIDVAANSAEVETGGVRVNMIPREGGNKFSGSFFGDVGSLQSDNISDALQARGLQDGNRVKSLWSVNPTFGGPILRDRLWFFGSYTRKTADVYAAGTYYQVNHTSTVYNPDLTRQAVSDQWNYNGGGRLTWQASPRNKLSVYADYNENCLCHYLVTSNVVPEATNNLWYETKIGQATWSSPVTSRLLFEAGVATAPQHAPRLVQEDLVTLPGILDNGTGWTLRSIEARQSGQAFGVRDHTNTTVRGAVSYVTGTHALKAGLTAIIGSHRFGLNSIEGVHYVTVNGTPTQAVYNGFPTLAAHLADGATLETLSFVRPNLGVYAQDQWTLAALTVNAGLRFDMFRSRFPDLSVPPTRFVPVARSVDGQMAVNWKNVSPRLGIAYDLRGNGKTAIKASLARYVLQEGTSRADSLIALGNNNTDPRRWTDNGDFVVQGNPFDPAANGELGPSTNLNFGKPTTNLSYDPEWATGFGVRPSNWEISTSLQHELAPRISASAAYYRRLYVSFPVVDNILVGPSDFSPYCVTAPVDSRLPGGGGYNICGLYDLDPPKVGQINRVTTQASNFGKQYEHWNGFDFTIDARMERLLLQGGVSTGKQVTDSCDVVSKVDNPSPLYCHTEEPFLTQVKLLGAYTLPLDIQLSATYQDIAGPAIAANAVFTSAQIAPSLGRPLSSGSTVSVNIVEPGTVYGDRMRQLDMRVAKILRVGHIRVKGMVDVYNVLNVGTPLALNTTYGATTGAATGASWLLPTGIGQGRAALMPPRLLKLGVQMNF